MRVLVACEMSGRVREAFRKKGHDAWSCDLLQSQDGSPFHLQADVRKVLVQQTWDIMIAFPPCTHLCASGARWWKDKAKEQAEAIAFVRMLASVTIPYAIENPVGILSRVWRKPDQILQPWMFSHGETKATCLWLQGLPLLKPTDIVEGRESRIHRMPPSKDRSMLRSITYQGVARAMADQWGSKWG